MKKVVQLSGLFLSVQTYTPNQHVFICEELSISSSQRNSGCLNAGESPTGCYCAESGDSREADAISLSVDDELHEIELADRRILTCGVRIAASCWCSRRFSVVQEEEDISTGITLSPMNLHRYALNHAHRAEQWNDTVKLESGVVEQ